MMDVNSKERPGAPEATLYAFILEGEAPPQCNGFASTVQRAEAVPEDRSNRLADIDSDDDFVPMVADLPPPNPRHLSVNGVATSTFERTSSMPSSIIPSASSLTGPGITRTQSDALAGPSARVRNGPRLSSHIPTPTPLAAAAVDDIGSIPDFNISNALVIPANDYDVIMILDNREKESRSAAGRDKIEDALLQKGVKVEVRPLHLGDVAWIARRRDGVGGEDDECSLDYVCERKRLDDLCASIRDGRFTEQSVSLCIAVTE